MSKNVKINMYGASWCSACLAAEKLFTDHNISYNKIDVDADIDSAIDKGIGEIPYIEVYDGDILKDTIIGTPNINQINKLNSILYEGD